MIELTLAVAEQAVRAAQDRAKALGTPMTVTVVDEAGRLVLSARGAGTVGVASTWPEIVAAALRIRSGVTSISVAPAAEWRRARAAG